MTEIDIQKIADTVISSLEEKNKLKNTESPYKKTEKLLNYYNVFKKKLENKEQALENIVIRKSSSFGGNGGNYEYKSELEKREDKKEQLMELFNQYEEVIQMVDLGLEEIKNDPYYPVIDLYYFKKYRWEDIEEKLDLDNSVIYRNKKRLVTELSFNLFPRQLLN